MQQNEEWTRALCKLFAEMEYLKPKLRSNPTALEHEARRFVDTEDRLRRAWPREFRYNLKLRGTTHALEELEELRKLAEKLRKRIGYLDGDNNYAGGMCVEAQQAFKSSLDFGFLADKLSELISQIKHAKRRLEQEEFLPGSQKGRRKLFEQKFTALAADTYEQLTDARGRVGRNTNDKNDPAGHFFRFVEGVFKIFDIDASAGSQIKLLIKKWNQGNRIRK